MKTKFYYVCLRIPNVPFDRNADRFTSKKNEALRVARKFAKTGEDADVAVYIMTTADIPAKRLLELALTQTATRQESLWLVNGLWSEARLLADNTGTDPTKLQVYRDNAVVWSGEIDEEGQPIPAPINPEPEEESEESEDEIRISPSIRRRIK